MKAVIDRIEHDLAVLLLGDDEVRLDIPLHFLPREAKEGTWLRLDFRIDEHTTEERYRQNKFMLDKLINKRKENKKPI